jgi:DNA (cytosine-5)-methyltransferase 1
MKKYHADKERIERIDIPGLSSTINTISVDLDDRRVGEVDGGCTIKRKALDLFCKAGGASMGLYRAGFEVIGIDIEPQPNYPFAFFQGDALEYPLDGFDLIWASPPCQAFTAYKRRKSHVKPAPNLIPQIRERLIAAKTDYIIENVAGAPLKDAVMLCGSMFGLDVQRHRYFECSFHVPQPSCNHRIWTPRFPPASNRTNLRKTVEIGVWRIPLAIQQNAMDIDWMCLIELSQAIPPVYSQHLAGLVPYAS